MAGMATPFSGDGLQPLPLADVAHVIEKRPGSIERGRAKVVGVPAYRIARGIAHRAIDALDGGVRGQARRRAGWDAFDCVDARQSRREHTLGGLPLFEERLQVAGEILDNWQIGEGSNLELAVLDHLGGMRTAGPARPAVDRHGTASAHAHPTGKTIRQCGIGVALHPGDNVENGLVVALWHTVELIVAVRFAAPQRYCNFGHCCYLTQTRRRCTALLPNPPASQRGSRGWVAPLASVARQANSYSPASACHR